MRMLAVIFEILAVIFGTIDLFTANKLTPQINFIKAMVSHYYEIDNCKKIFSILMSLCYVFNTIALFYYIGPMGLVFIFSLLSVVTNPYSKLHLVSSFLPFLLYGLASVIYRPLLLINYLPILGLIYALYTYKKYRTNSVGLIMIVYSAAALMLINILVVGKT